MNREDILNSLGLQTMSESRDSILPAMGIFGAGILVGAGLGMLFAPKPGRELREDLRRNAGDLGENIKNRAGELREKLPDVGGMIQNVQNRVTGGGDDEQKQLAGNTGGQSASKRKNEGPGGETRPGQH